MCACRDKGHKPGRLEVGDSVCVPCSLFMCTENRLPFWGPESFDEIVIPGNPLVCVDADKAPTENGGR